MQRLQRYLQLKSQRVWPTFARKQTSFTVAHYQWICWDPGLHVPASRQSRPLLLRDGLVGDGDYPVRAATRRCKGLPRPHPRLRLTPVYIIDSMGRVGYIIYGKEDSARPSRLSEGRSNRRRRSRFYREGELKASFNCCSSPIYSFFWQLLEKEVDARIAPSQFGSHSFFESM